tara:strand:+ start:1545 stop:1718 length:174 start_codon:yes stop_codon:yes gene_type:complete
MIKQINDIQAMFAFYGFITCPLSRKQIAKYIVKGKTSDQIYEIGCGIYCGYRGSSNA